MTADDFDELAILMRRYAEARMMDDRGPVCELCDGTPTEHEEHAGVLQHVCKTVEAILDQAVSLIKPAPGP